MYLNHAFKIMLISVKKTHQKYLANHLVIYCGKQSLITYILLF